MFMLVCPVEGCGHFGETFTNNHCVTMHGMNKSELIEKYGQPRRVGGSFAKSGHKIWNRAMDQR